MQALNLPASRGWRWISEGFLLFRKKQLMVTLVVLGYWVLMALINALPLVGQVAATLLIPVFAVSLMNLFRCVEDDVPVPPQILFSGFRRNLGSLLVLGFAYGALSVGILGLISVFDGGVLLRLIVLGERPAGDTLISADVIVAGQLAMAMFVPLIMAFWFAPVLVAWHNLQAAKALFFSLVACARNWRVFLVYAGATLLFGAILPGVVVGMLSLMFSDVSKVFSVMFTTLIVLVILPTLYASFYVSYREVFVFDDEND